MIRQLRRQFRDDVVDRRSRSKVEIAGCDPGQEAKSQGAEREVVLAGILAVLEIVEVYGGGGEYCTDVFCIVHVCWLKLSCADCAIHTKKCVFKAPTSLVS
jgi:hypothetical protein